MQTHFVLLAGMFAFGIISGANLVVDEIVAKVNGDIITRSEMQHQSDNTAGALSQKLDQEDRDALRERIDRILLLQKARELNLNTDAQVSRAMAKLQYQSGITDEDHFRSFVRDRAGMPYEQYVSDMRDRFAMERVILEQVGRRIVIRPSEVLQYYDDHKAEFVREERIFLREIFLSTEGRDAAGIAKTEAHARELATRARKGERFGELARMHSESPASEHDGDIGGFRHADLDQELEPLVWNQDRGSIVGPIRRRSPEGFLILRVEKKHRAGQASLEEVEEEITERLYMAQLQPRIREYLTDLRYEAFLGIKPGYVDTGAAEGKDTRWLAPDALTPMTVTKEEVANERRRRRLFGLIPLPGTSTTVKPGVSRSM